MKVIESLARKLKQSLSKQNRRKQTLKWKVFVWPANDTPKANGTFSSAFQFEREREACGKLSVTTSTDFAVWNYENPRQTNSAFARQWALQETNAENSHLGEIVTSRGEGETTPENKSGTSFVPATVYKPDANSSLKSRRERRYERRQPV